MRIKQGTLVRHFTTWLEFIKADEGKRCRLLFAEQRLPGVQREKKIMSRGAFPRAFCWLHAENEPHPFFKI